MKKIKEDQSVLPPVDEPPINILLVDDRPDGLLVLETVLHSPHYNLVNAASGPQAIERLMDQEFAVILLDVQMPVMDGFETAALIKERPPWKDIPILFVTAIHNDTSYVYEGYGVGAVDYISKPFDPYILKSKVAIFAELYRKNKRLKQAQEELRRKEEELYQARKLEAIGRLAGGVAHDFNNIAAGILGISEEMRDAMDPNDRRRDDLNEIVKATQRAFSLTRQLLAYARRQMISPEVLDLNTVVLDMRGMLSRLIREDIELKTDLDPQLGPISADRGYLEQVLVNLVLNARDAMPEGGLVTIRTANVDLSEPDVKSRVLQVPPGHYILLSISDTGCGMSDAILEHVFEPFFTTKEKDKGTGLGLATVYGIVKQNGGDVAVHSKVKAGTRMEIYLPRLAVEVRPAAIVNASAVLSPGSETILVAEDERLVRRVVTSILTKNGYAVLQAANGPEALVISERHEGAIDLLITDVVMPELNGRELAHLMSAKRPTMGVLYMSGYPENVIAHRGVLDPGIAFIEKAHISSELAAKVRQVLLARHQQLEVKNKSRTPIVELSSQ